MIRSAAPVGGWVAGLPMYDWPEVRDEVDALWAAIARRLCQVGVDAPVGLWRPDHVSELWVAPNLLAAQVCGLNVVGSLRGRVEVLGALDYGVEGCQPGDYRSVVACHAGDPADGLDDFRGRCAAINGRESQSGHAALVDLIAPLAEGGRFFDEVVETGSHRASIRAVAEGRADLTSIDAVAWSLATSHEPAVDELRIIGWTEPMPAPPLVIGWAHVGLRETVNAAVSEAVALLGEEVRRPLDLYGYRVRSTSDYEVLADRLAAAEVGGYPVVA
ncbi:MAG: PhnD/SsuA/transferrin family substrate-binding protein [Actinobacteria bacterium]|nr:PhnD/SsuA/transferrin family substrate-binding protein [Actinomycetota bacterium]MDP7551043.1 PhnD/SsuA/transferrin family substrate-binding protein [Acidimicrobiales bacterium]MBT3688345.1 PhnD/SsuA/transferrin family substrate-binding protein [Actinomycetota bacterium]MBT4037243.1 PhnD/SsuA/transferrin family substrate-binding protein [Actinomycetota bacterium]MBT4278757.1 PhnD/SsuA/transferrin family substrate-binding protein [Actinomycetota bacterium]